MRKHNQLLPNTSHVFTVHVVGILRNLMTTPAMKTFSTAILLAAISLLLMPCEACTGGKGGGKPDSAMGGGTELLKVDDALAAVDDFVAEKLK